MFKNVASKIALFAFDTTTGAAKTGDSANITAYVSKDYGAVTVLGDTTATEMDATNAKGLYLFDTTASETNADALIFSGKSSTANVSIVPQYIFTTPNRFTTLVIDSAGLADATAVKLGPSGSATAQTAKDVGAAVPAAAAGASGGLLISGSNSGTTTLAALTVTGTMTVSDGIVVSRSTGNSSAITATGNGTGHGLSITSGSGATGNGINVTSSATNGNAINVAGAGTGDGLKTTGGATGHGFEIIGGGTSGDGIKITTTSGHGMNVAATGTSKHGATFTGGNAGTSDGVVMAAGTGGVDLRANQTGNITGNLSGSVGSVTGSVGSVTGAVGSVTGNVGGNVVGSVGSVTGAVGSVTGNVGGNVVGSVASVTGSVGSVTGAVGSVTGNVGGNVVGSVASVTGAVGSIGTGGITTTSFAAGAIDAAAIAANAIGASELASDAVTEIQTGLATAATVASVLALLDDPRGEPGQGAPPVNPDMATKVDYIYKFARNKVDQTSTQLSIYADDATTVDHKAPVSDDGTTFTRGELATGP